MRKLKLLLSVLLFSLLANSQAGQINQINIVNFTVKNALPGTVDSWLSTPGALVLTAQKVPGTQVREPMMVLQIRSNGAIVCGNSMATPKRIDPFDVRVFSTADLLGLLGNCHELKAGNYTICVQFFNIDKVAISREVCKDFRVEDANVEYAPPTLIIPDNGKKFSMADLMKPLQFRWTPLVPKPREPVTYRLRVWQLMQGQNGVAAMRSNSPIADKEVKEITQATLTNLLTGPCKPPYLCDFIWNVQAQNRDGKPMGKNNGMSESYTFSAIEEKIKGPDNVFPENQKEFKSEEVKQSVTFRWTHIVPKPQDPVTYRLKVWQLMQGQNGTTAMRTNQPIVTKDVDNLTQATVGGIYTGPCKPPYLCDFIWNVEALTRDGKTIGTSEPTVFGVTEEKSKGPDNVFPENTKEFQPEEVKESVTFRWTPVVPKPQSVTYRIKVWQLMQGQSSTEAIRSNQPIVTKDVDNITQATVSGIYTGPCKPPYLCDFVWNVEATTRQAGAAPKIIGTSTPTTFSIAPQYIIQLDSIKVLCTDTSGVYSFKYCITNPNPGIAKLLNLTVTSSLPAGATLGTFSPPLNTLIPPGGQLCITGTINAPSNLSNICIGAAIQDQTNTFWQAQRDTCIPVLPCKCEACDSVKIEVNPKGDITLDANGNIIQNNTITVSPKPVKNIKAELVYFEYKPDSDDCMICNKDSKTYGNFINAETGLVSPTIPYPHTVNWAPNGQMVTNQAMGFTISMPPTVKCCAAQVKWCIRYVVTFMDCTVCNKLVCYSYNKKCDCK